MNREFIDISFDIPMFKEYNLKNKTVKVLNYLAIYRHFHIRNKKYIKDLYRYCNKNNIDFNKISSNLRVVFINTVTKSSIINSEQFELLNESIDDSDDDSENDSQDDSDISDFNTLNMNKNNDLINKNIKISNKKLNINTPDNQAIPNNIINNSINKTSMTLISNIANANNLNTIINNATTQSLYSNDKINNINQMHRNIVRKVDLNNEEEMLALHLSLKLFLFSTEDEIINTEVINENLYFNIEHVGKAHLKESTIYNNKLNLFDIWALQHLDINETDTIILAYNFISKEEMEKNKLIIRDEVKHVYSFYYHITNYRGNIPKAMVNQVFDSKEDFIGNIHEENICSSRGLEKNNILNANTNMTRNDISNTDPTELNNIKSSVNVGKNEEINETIHFNNNSIANSNISFNNVLVNNNSMMNTSFNNNYTNNYTSIFNYIDNRNNSILNNNFNTNHYDNPLKRKVLKENGDNYYLDNDMGNNSEKINTDMIDFLNKKNGRINSNSDTNTNVIIDNADNKDIKINDYSIHKQVLNSENTNTTNTINNKKIFFSCKKVKDNKIISNSNSSIKNEDSIKATEEKKEEENNNNININEGTSNIKNNVVFNSSTSNNHYYMRSSIIKNNKVNSNNINTNTNTKVPELNSKSNESDKLNSQEQGKSIGISNNNNSLSLVENINELNNDNSIKPACLSDIKKALEDTIDKRILTSKKLLKLQNTNEILNYNTLNYGSYVNNSSSKFTYYFDNFRQNITKNPDLGFQVADEESKNNNKIKSINLSEESIRESYNQFKESINNMLLGNKRMKNENNTDTDTAADINKLNISMDFDKFQNLYKNALLNNCYKSDIDKALLYSNVPSGNNYVQGLYSAAEAKYYKNLKDKDTNKIDQISILNYINPNSKTDTSKSDLNDTSILPLSSDEKNNSNVYIQFLFNGNQILNNYYSNTINTNSNSIVSNTCNILNNINDEIKEINNDTINNSNNKDIKKTPKKRGRKPKNANTSAVVKSNDKQRSTNNINNINANNKNDKKEEPKKFKKIFNSYKKEKKNNEDNSHLKANTDNNNISSNISDNINLDYVRNFNYVGDTNNSPIEERKIPNISKELMETNAFDEEYNTNSMQNDNNMSTLLQNYLKSKSHSRIKKIDSTAGFESHIHDMCIKDKNSKLKREINYYDENNNIYNAQISPKDDSLKANFDLSIERATSKLTLLENNFKNNMENYDTMNILQDNEEKRLFNSNNNSIVRFQTCNNDQSQNDTMMNAEIEDLNNKDSRFLPDIEDFKSNNIFDFKIDIGNNFTPMSNYNLASNIGSRSSSIMKNISENNVFKYNRDGYR